MRYFFFSHKISKIWYFTLKIHFDADTRLSSDMLSLYLDLMELTIEKYTHILMLFETPQLFSNNQVSIFTFNLNKSRNSVLQLHQPHFKCLIATRAQWPLHWTRRIERESLPIRFYPPPCCYSLPRAPSGGLCLGQAHTSER